MVGSKFFVFGGQVDGEFLNDIWSFDLNSRKTFNEMPLPSILNHNPVRTKAAWELVSTSPEQPAPRTGHVMVTYGEKILL